MSATQSASNGTASAAAAKGAAAHAEGPEVNVPLLLWHANIVLLALLGVLVLLRLPRLFARLSVPSEWLQGHIFAHKALPATRRRADHSIARRPTYSSEKTAYGGSDDSHTIHAHAQYIQRLDKHAAGGPPANCPPHLAACPRFFRPLTAPFHWRFTAGYSFYQVATCMIWFAVMAYTAFYMSNPFSDPARTGAVAVAQMVWVFAFGTKANPIGLLLGIGYEKLNFIHRFVGRLVVLAVNIHTLGYFYKWSIAGTFAASLQKPFIVWGLVATICMDVLFFLSTDYWRKNWYTIFLWSHIAAFIVLIPATYMHMPTFLPYIIAVCVIYGFDHLYRIIKTRFHTVTLRALPELGIVRMEVPQINTGWRAGQHMRVRVLSGGMGLYGWSEVHPFTIASAPNSHEGLVLLIKKTGTWTTRLFEMAKSGGYYDAGTDRQVKVMLEGPYGGPGDAIFHSYSAGVFVCGGSGITFGLASMQDILQRDLERRSRVKVLELIWIIQDAASLAPLLPQLTALLQTSSTTQVNISVHYTRVSASGKLPFDRNSLPPGLTLSGGRPRTLKVLDATISRTASLGRGYKDEDALCGMLVGVCGPVALADDVNKAVSWIDPVRRDQIGGIEIHEEVFGW
ncbi:hypothetical protein K525DRAFT_220344 [Schizophyllum commune Loenen D]|nr:hypothetical protein K525DRAFT_220344 [Schizophyllum commune Loenen D]